MESEKPPSEPHKPSVEILLNHPSSEIEQLERIAQKTLGGAVEIVICDPGIMRFLNLRWRHIDRPTDVLTFDLSEPGGEPAGVIYVDGRLAPPLQAVLERVCHGWLHLNGMTHHTEVDRTIMEERTRELVATAMEVAGAE